MWDTIRKLQYRANANVPGAKVELDERLHDRMNLVAEITVKKAAAILGNSESAARNTLRSLVKKGYLTEDMSKVPFLYSMEQHMPM